MAKTITIEGKEVPLTKNGLPNRVYLSKEAKEVVAAYADKQKKDKKEIMIKELTDQLAKLG
jgi:hypothetical protein